MIDQQLFNAGNISDNSVLFEVLHIFQNKIQRKLWIKTNHHQIRYSQNLADPFRFADTPVDNLFPQGVLQDFFINVKGTDLIRPLLSDAHGQCAAHESQTDKADGFSF